MSHLTPRLIQNLLRSCGLVFGVGVLIASSGCQNEEVRQYSVGRSEVKRDASRLESYELPKGWVRQTPKDQKLTAAAFRVSEDNQAAEITITRLERDGGGLVANIERWRTSLKLEPLREEKDRKELAKETKVGGLLAYYVDLMGSDKVPAEQRRIVGVMVFPGPVSWFFKMQGPVDFMGKQKKAFESFIESIQFGVTGANDG